MTDERVDNEAESLQQYIWSNGQELYQFFMDNSASLESVCNEMVRHSWKSDQVWGQAVRDKIESEIEAESYEKARERIYGED